MLEHLDCAGCVGSAPGTFNIDRGIGVCRLGPLLVGRTLEENYWNQHFQSYSTTSKRSSGSAGVIVSGRLPVRARLTVPSVSSVILLSRYMRPEGPWQRIAAALVDSSDHFSAFSHTLSQIEMIDHSRAP